MESIIKTAFDLPILEQISSSVTDDEAINRYFFDEYTSSYIPINGSHLSYPFFTKTNSTTKKRDAILSRGDHFCPLLTVFKNNGLNTQAVLKDCILPSSEKFLYYISPRYFVNNCLLFPKHNFLADVLTPEHIQAINENRCMFLLCDIFECSFYTPSVINNFEKMCKQINLALQKVIICTNNINNTNNTPGLQIVYWQYFETAIKAAYRANVFELYETTERLPFFRFLLLNCRTRQHRFYVSYKLWKNDQNFLKHYSFSHNKTTLKDLTNETSYIARDAQQSCFNYFNTDYKKEKDDINQFIELLPLNSIFDRSYIKKEMYKRYYTNLHREQVCSNAHEHGMFCKLNHWKHFHKQMQTNIGIHIVTETLADMTNNGLARYMFLTEKTFKPILFKKPFIIVGQPGILYHLQQNGYKTFNTLWDESYDSTADPKARFDKITDLLLHLSQLDDTSFNILLRKTSDIVDHNFNHFMNRTPETQLVDIIKQFFK